MELKFCIICNESLMTDSFVCTKCNNEIQPLDRFDNDYDIPKTIRESAEESKA